MSTEDELNAMQQIAAALKPLGDDGRVRTLQWAFSHFCGSSKSSIGELPVLGPPTKDTSVGSAQFEAFAELFEAAHPKTDREKALVACYWVQICQSQQSFASQTLNAALKDLGHGVSNITDALSALKDERPALALQLKKSGTSQQARKTYKLTQEGVRRVQAMIRGEASDTDGGGR